MLSLSADTVIAAVAAPQYLAAGGLLSLLKPNTPDIFVFDVSDADKPVYKYGLTTSMGACPDEFVAARSGGFYASSMCSRTGKRNSSSLCSEQGASHADGCSAAQADRAALQPIDCPWAAVQQGGWRTACYGVSTTNHEHEHGCEHVGTTNSNIDHLSE